MAINIALVQSYTYRDAKGNTARVSLYVAGNTPDANYPANPYTDAKNISADLANLTNAALQVAHGIYEFAPGTVQYGASGTVYETVEDKAVFTFADFDGGVHRYAVPAPKAAIFLADAETVDNSNALVKQMVADFLNATYNGTAPTAGQSNGVYSRQLVALAAFYGGIRQRRKIHRKINIFTKNPALTGPDE